MGARGRLKAGTETAAILPPKLHRYEMVPLSELKPDPTNARENHNVDGIVASYAEFGVIDPVITDEQLRIIAGHGRYAAATRLRLSEVAVLIVEGLTTAQRRAYALADNKLTDSSRFNEEMLVWNVEQILLEEPEFDIEVTGFETAEIDHIVGNARAAQLNDLEDEPPEPSTEAAVSREGDIWVLDRHRLACGDSTSPQLVNELIGAEQARLVLSDVPFNTKIEGFVSGLGRKSHKDFAMAAGEMSRSEFVSFLVRANGAYIPHLIDGAFVLLFIDWRHVADMLEAGDRSGFELKNILTWVKSNAGMGSLWRSQHELICAFKHGKAEHLNNVKLGVHGRNRSNVLQYPGMNAPGRGRAKALEMHATVKPVALIADLILDVTNRGDVVLDPFGGSGTAIIAAERVGRRAFVSEISPTFVDVGVRRWEALTGRPAHLAATGQTFAEIAAERLDVAGGDA